ncbi:hypothetical protein PVMG_05824 [Plasmodium vivax Mauritania I]|uniref:Variable surface protein n=1 Tax=Plasmodium vivax Mauritania I TaxID=1035515 RepID=A0A0J9TJ18_PLAVI|nr:hypothetical protein PVMG_05824 [Plasmodium vivax Mauritania I]
MQKELKYTNIRENLSHNKMSKYMKNKLEITPTYGDKKGVGLNKLDIYMKGYKTRYSKKKGLGKLECYYEKKIFDKIDYIEELAEKMQNDKMSFRKKIFYKIIIPFFLFALVPVLGSIFYILFGGGENALITWCKKVHPDRTVCKQKYMIHAKEGILHAIENLNLIFFYIVFFIIVTVIIYAVIKVVKYERLKSGKGKMNAKEYYNLTKELFSMK